VFAKAFQIATADFPVLILGESGTGKELLARAVHQHSPRRNGPFVPLNCGAVSEGLVESELFGHRKGAFTNAVSDKRGLVEEADTGVLFLDEVGDMPPYVQVRLLRFLDSGELRRIGETSLRGSNVRIIAATNRNLAEDTRTGRFREDLFYRLGVSLHMPALRDRGADILMLAEHFLEQISARLNLHIQGFTHEVADLLRNYLWPGNVRELRTAIEGAAVLAGNEPISSVHLPAAILQSQPSFALDSDADAERRQLAVALEQSGGSHLLAARTLGISRTTLWRRLRRSRLA
jgi:transcriptional regulator with PAS, ATPase and Fis domain